MKYPTIIGLELVNSDSTYFLPYQAIKKFLELAEERNIFVCATTFDHANMCVSKQMDAVQVAKEAYIMNHNHKVDNGNYYVDDNEYYYKVLRDINGNIIEHNFDDEYKRIMAY